MKGPQGQWRPDDEISAAVHTMKIATGEIEETFDDGWEKATREEKEQEKRDNQAIEDHKRSLKLKS